MQHEAIALLRRHFGPSFGAVFGFKYKLQEDSVKEQQQIIDKLKKENRAHAKSRGTLDKLAAKVDRLASQLSQTAYLNSN